MLARTRVDAGDGGLSPSQVQGVSAWAGTRAAGFGGGRGSRVAFSHRSQLRGAAKRSALLGLPPRLGAHSSPGPVALQFWFVSLPAGWEGWGGQGRSGW